VPNGSIIAGTRLRGVHSNAGDSEDPLLRSLLQIKEKAAQIEESKKKFLKKRETKKKSKLAYSKISSSKRKAE